MRLNALTRSLEQEFLADGIPFKVFGGFKFFERKEIKDLLAYLRLINNPFDSEALTRIINFPKRGIGAKTVEILQNYAYENELSVYDALYDLDVLGFTGATKQKLDKFKEISKELIVKEYLGTPNMGKDIEYEERSFRISSLYCHKEGQCLRVAEGRGCALRSVA